MKKRTSFLLIVLFCTTASTSHTADQAAPKRGHGFFIPATFNLAGERLYPNPNALISMLGFVVGWYGTKLYCNGCEKIASANNDKCDQLKAGQQLQADGLKLGAVSALLILHKTIIDYVRIWL